MSEIDEDTLHTAKVMKAFASYKLHSRQKICSHIASFRALSSEHMALVAEPHSQHIRAIFNHIDENQKFLNDVIDFASHMLPNTNDASALINQQGPPTVHFMDKVRSVIRQFAREWSSLGATERAASFDPIINSVLQYFPKENRHEVKIFVPGAGLGRLAADLVELGYTVEANEYSMFMLLASHFILNKQLENNSVKLYPFALETLNLWKYEDAEEAIEIPDKCPRFLEDRQNSFSMSAGSFLDVTAGSPEEYNCICTCWFVDTANNVIDYMERIFLILKPGGYWINVGPLTYHFSEMPNEISLELPYSEIIRIATKIGFEILEERQIESFYTGNPRSMLRQLYTCAFFVARKPSPSAE